jgi:hypothetical protein
MTREKIEDVASKECCWLMFGLPNTTHIPYGLSDEVMKRVGERFGFGSFSLMLHRTPTFPYVNTLFREWEWTEHWFYSLESLKTLKGMIVDRELRHPERHIHMPVRPKRDLTPLRRRRGRKMELFYDHRVHQHPTEDMASVTDLPHKIRNDMEKDIQNEVRRTFNECWKEMHKRPDIWW